MPEPSEQSVIKLYWKSYHDRTPKRGYWDYIIVEDLLSGRLWRPANPYSFTSEFTDDRIHNGEGAIVVLPARHHADLPAVELLNEDIAHAMWTILLLLGDEESAFPIHKVRHSNIRLWRMMANPNDPHVHTRLINGYTPHVHLLDDTPCPTKQWDWSFLGQNTHPRREACVEQLTHITGGFLLPTRGFTQGVSPEEYVKATSLSKVVPCPSGPQAPDSFRLAEALELGCVPLADAHAPVAYPNGYWQSVLGTDIPFPIIEDWTKDTRPVMEQALAQWPSLVNRCGSFWMQHKRNLAYRLHRDIQTLSQSPAIPEWLDDQITCLIYTSPSPAHPSTEHLDRVIQSIRHHFPLAEILLACDGVRPEMEHARPAYEEYLRRVIWKCQRDHTYWNVLPIVFPTHHHQAKMARYITQNDLFVETPLMLVLEHDTPLVIPHEYVSYDARQIDTGRPIEWPAIFRTVLDGHANVVRLYHRGDGMPEAHRWLCRDKVTWHDTQFWKVVQWSNRPHVISTEYFRQMLFNHFSPNANCFIEDRLMTFIQNQPWEQHKVVIYWPSDEEAMRSWHSEGRVHQGEWWPKFEEEQIF